MRRLTTLLLLLTFSTTVAAADDDEKKAEELPPALKTTSERAGYAIGLQIGSQLREDGLQVDTNALALGIADVLAGKKPRLSDKDLQNAIAALQQELRAKREALGKKNEAEGAAFLAANKKKDGVKTTASGLQYQVLKSGNGATPKASDTVRTHYHGTLIDGTVFDSSVEREEPISFPVGGVIRGWTEALQLMKVGDKWRLFVPSELAYGPRGSGPKIGPNATLIFEVELLDIE